MSMQDALLNAVIKIIELAIIKYGPDVKDYIVQELSDLVDYAVEYIMSFVDSSDDSINNDDKIKQIEEIQHKLLLLKKNGE